MLVLGIDPGTAVTGYGVVRGERGGLPTLVECGVIRTRAREPLPVAAAEIYEGVVEMIARHQARMRWRSKMSSTRTTYGRRSCSDTRAA